MQILCALCASSFQKNMDGSITINEVIDGVTCPSFPFHNPKVSFVLAYTLSPADSGQDFEIKLTLIDADGHEGGNPGIIHVGEKDVPLDRYDTRWVRMVSKDLVFKAPGMYRFEVYVNSKLCAEVPLVMSPLT